MRGWLRARRGDRSATAGRPAIAFAAIALLGGLAVALSPSSAGGQPPGPHLRPDGHVAIAWLYGGSSADYRAQIDAAAGLSTISPTWWYLDEDRPGQLELATDDALTAYAHERGLAVWPLFGNHIDPDLTDQVLRDPALRGQVVDGIAAEVRRSGVDGVNVDFENLHDRTAPLLTDLVAELKAALPDRVISVDVTAMTDTWVLGNWSTAFDREGLGRVADYVVLMAYDEHNALRRDGPVAGLSWVAESTAFLLRTVPAHKVVLGVPLYARDWAEDPTATDGIDLDATLGMAAMAQRMAERSQAVTYDPVAGQDLHTYTDERGRPHRVWLEDVASLQRKTQLVAEHGLAGIAAWRAGFEPPEVWVALDAQMAAMAPPGTAPAGTSATGTSAAGQPPAPSPLGQPAPEVTAPTAQATAVDPRSTPAPPTAVPTAAALPDDVGAVPVPDATTTTSAEPAPPRTSWISTAAVLLALVAVGLAAGGRVGRRRGTG